MMRATHLSTEARIVAVTDNSNVDPALLPLVEGFPPIDVTAETLAGFRAAMIEMSVLPDPATHTDVLVAEVRALP